MRLAALLHVLLPARVIAFATLRPAHAPSPACRPRPRSLPLCWTGETSATIEIAGVPVSRLYESYADLRRMTEWSPLLDSVSVDPDRPSRSVWVMTVPRALKVPARLLGYTTTLSWQAELAAPRPPLMTWTSVLDEQGKLEGIPNAGFVPSGAIEVVESRPGVAAMTLTLRYALPDPAAGWQVALIQSAPVQFVLSSRIEAGLRRFSRAMRREWEDEQAAHRAADRASGRHEEAGVHSEDGHTEGRQPSTDLPQPSGTVL